MELRSATKMKRETGGVDEVETKPGVPARTPLPLAAEASSMHIEAEGPPLSADAPLSSPDRPPGDVSPPTEGTSHPLHDTAGTSEQGKDPVSSMVLPAVVPVEAGPCVESDPEAKGLESKWEPGAESEATTSKLGATGAASGLMPETGRGLVPGGQGSRETSQCSEPAPPRSSTDRPDRSQKPVVSCLPSPTAAPAPVGEDMTRAGAPPGETTPDPLELSEQSESKEEGGTGRMHDGGGQPPMLPSLPSSSPPAGTGPETPGTRRREERIETIALSAADSEFRPDDCVAGRKEETVVGPDSPAPRPAPEDDGPGPVAAMDVEETTPGTDAATPAPTTGEEDPGPAVKGGGLAEAEPRDPACACPEPSQGPLPETSPGGSSSQEDVEGVGKGRGENVVTTGTLRPNNRTPVDKSLASIQAKWETAQTWGTRMTARCHRLGELSLRQLDQLRACVVQDMRREALDMLRGCQAEVRGVGEKVLQLLEREQDRAQELSRSLRNETARRRELLNALQELRGNIRVLCRVRPPASSPSSTSTSAPPSAPTPPSGKGGELGVAVTSPTEVSVRTDRMGPAAAAKIFELDAVLGPESDQVGIWAEVQPLVTSTMDGYQACIFAYGQTGSGKTFTMEGAQESLPGGEPGAPASAPALDPATPEEVGEGDPSLSSAPPFPSASPAEDGELPSGAGVNPRALAELFRLKQEKEAGGMATVQVSVSMVEIYNETIRDLLASPPPLPPLAPGKEKSKDPVYQAAVAARKLWQPPTLEVKQQQPSVNFSRPKNQNTSNKNKPKEHDRKDTTASKPADAKGKGSSATAPPISKSNNLNSKSSSLPSSSTPGVYLPGAVSLPVDSAAAIHKIIRMGQRHRTVAATRANHASSRSHSLLLTTVLTTDSVTGIVSTGRLILVDLAGSERLSKTGAEGVALKEAQNINKSLSALGDVIQALRARQEGGRKGGKEDGGPGQQHIPFRNSKLTYLLQDALGAENKCLMVVCVSPDKEDSSESLCSLTFAQRVHGVILGAAKAHGGKLDTRAHKEAVLKAKEETKAAEAARALLAEEMAKLQAELHETREAQAAAEREQGHMGLAVAHMQEAHGDQATQWAEEKEKYERALEDAHRQWQAARHAAHRLKEEHHLELEQQRMHVEELMIEKGKLQAQLAAATSAPPSLARTNLTNTTPRRVPVGKEKRDTIREAIHPGAGIPAAAAPATAVAAAAVRDQRVLREKTGPGGETSNCRMGQERGEKSEREDLTKVVPSVKMGGDSAHVKSVDGSSSDGSSNHSTGVRNDSHSHETTANTDGDNLKKRGGTVSDRDLAAPCTEADASDSTSLKRSRAVAEPEGSPGPAPTQNLSSPSAILPSPTPFRPWESNSERNIEAVPEALPTKRQKKVTFMIPSPGPRLPTEGDILEGDPDFGPVREGEREENGPDGAEGGVEASFQHPHYRTTPFKKQEGPGLLAPATLGHQVGHGHPATSTSKSVPAPATKNPRPLMMHSNASFGSNHNAPNGLAGGSGYAPLGMPARVMHPSGPTSTSSGPTGALSSAPMRKAAARVPSVPSYKTLGGGSSCTAAVGCGVERTKERVLWSSGNGVNTAPGAGSTRFNENAGKGHSDDKGSGGGRWR